MADPLDLARRAVACPAWRWMPGMRSNFGARYLGAGLWIDEHASGAVYADPNIGEVPDLTDPATLGCVLALICEEWGQPAGIAALVAALEAHHA